MSHDAFAGYVFTISDEKVKETVPDEHKALMEFCERKNVDFVNFAEFINTDPDCIDELDDDDYETVVTLYQNLTREFLKKTKVEIGLFSIESHEQSVYNETEEWHWIVFDAVEIRPEVSKLGVYWEDQKFFSVFG